MQIHRQNTGEETYLYVIIGVDGLDVGMVIYHTGLCWAACYIRLSGAVDMHDFARLVYLASLDMDRPSYVYRPTGQGVS